MRPLVIVKPQPLSCIVLNLLKVVEQVFADPAISYSAVRPLNIRVLLWLARLNVFNTDIVLTHPGCEFSADKLRLVVHFE